MTHLLLGTEDLGGGNFDTHVATSNHDTVSLGENVGKVVEALSVLNLGDNLDVGAILAKDITDVTDVLASSDERGKDHINTVLDTKPQVVLVLFGKGREIDVGVGQVDALLRRDEAIVAGTNLNRLIVLDAKNVKGEDTVIDIDDAAGLNHLGDVGIVNVPIARQRRLAQI